MVGEPVFGMYFLLMNNFNKFSLVRKSIIKNIFTLWSFFFITFAFFLSFTVYCGRLWGTLKNTPPIIGKRRSREVLNQTLIICENFINIIIIFFYGEGIPHPRSGMGDNRFEPVAQIAKKPYSNYLLKPFVRVPAPPQ